MHSKEERGRLDSAIDRAVRGLMQVNPRPGLRHRVASRLGAPAPRISWMLPTAATAALFVVVLVAWMLLHAPGGSPAPQSHIAVTPATTPDSHPTVPVPVQPAASAPRTPARPPQRRSEAVFGPRRDRVAAANVASVGTIAPMPAANAPYEPPALTGTVAPLAPILIAPIEVEPITIMPLTVTALRIRR